MNCVVLDLKFTLYEKIFNILPFEFEILVLKKEEFKILYSDITLWNFKVCAQWFGFVWIYSKLIFMVYRIKNTCWCCTATKKVNEWVIGFTSVQNTCKVPIFFFNINFPALKLMIIINNKVCVFMKPIMIIENKIQKIHETTLQEILYIILFTFINYWLMRFPYSK